MKKLLDTRNLGAIILIAMIINSYGNHNQVWRLVLGIVFVIVIYAIPLAEKGGGNCEWKDAAN